MILELTYYEQGEMQLRKQNENDLLEETLAIAEQGYAEAYSFLRNAYERNAENLGPQAFYFLACLAGGAGMPEAALEWLRKAIAEKGWWYRPEVLEDDDLAALNGNAAFLALKALSDARYASASGQARAVFSWERKTADKVFLAVHGNTQNAQTARADWAPVFAEADSWQIETIQSAEPDGYGTYRWSYDSTAYLPVAEAMERLRGAGYSEIVCGGFSAGCDMLLRAVTLTPARCGALILQSPWLPVLEAQGDAVVSALRQKGIALRLLCGSEDEDCLPMAKQLYDAAQREGLDAKLTIQAHTRHQFPAEPYPFSNL